MSKPNPFTLPAGEDTVEIDANFESETPRVMYGESAVFLRICGKCGRYVRAAKSICFTIDGDYIRGQRAGVCKVHGAVEMPFEGFI